MILGASKSFQATRGHAATVFGVLSACQLQVKASQLRRCWGVSQHSVGQGLLHLLRDGWRSGTPRS